MARGVMADLIEFPNDLPDMERLPEPPDPYRAYARPGTRRYPMISFVQPNGITCYRFSDIRRTEFSPAAMPGGLDVLKLHFSWPWAKTSATVLVEGRNLLDCVYFIGEELTGWLRVLPDGQQVKDPATPVITRIVLPPGEI
jgi:hypothetical protein